MSWLHGRCRFCRTSYGAPLSYGRIVHGPPPLLIAPSCSDLRPKLFSRARQSSPGLFALCVIDIEEQLLARRDIGAALLSV